MSASWGLCQGEELQEGLGLVPRAVLPAGGMRLDVEEAHDKTAWQRSRSPQLGSVSLDCSPRVQTDRSQHRQNALSKDQKNVFG
jgi:hypothetical protein